MSASASSLPMNSAGAAGGTAAQGDGSKKGKDPFKTQKQKLDDEAKESSRRMRMMCMSHCPIPGDNTAAEEIFSGLLKEFKSVFPHKNNNDIILHQSALKGMLVKYCAAASESLNVEVRVLSDPALVFFKAVKSFPGVGPALVYVVVFDMLMRATIAEDVQQGDLLRAATVKKMKELVNSVLFKAPTTSQETLDFWEAVGEGRVDVEDQQQHADEALAGKALDVLGERLLTIPMVVLTDMVGPAGDPGSTRKRGREDVGAEDEDGGAEDEDEDEHIVLTKGARTDGMWAALSRPDAVKVLKRLLEEEAFHKVLTEGARTDGMWAALSRPMRGISRLRKETQKRYA